MFILTRQHDEHYTSAYRMFLNNKLFGVGVKNFRNFVAEVNTIFQIILVALIHTILIFNFFQKLVLLVL